MEFNTKKISLFPTLFGSRYLYCRQTSIYYGPKQPSVVSEVQFTFSLLRVHVEFLLVEETNRYYHQYLNSLEDGPSPLPDVTNFKIFIFLGIINQMGHDIRGRLRDYWTTAEQFLTSFYSNTLKR
jgi:hypothetical protein